MMFQNLFVLTLKICSKTYDCFNPSCLLIKNLKGLIFKKPWDGPFKFSWIFSLDHSFEILKLNFLYIQLKFQILHDLGNTLI